MEIQIEVDTNKLQDFCRRWNVVELALFGSVLRRDFREDSDVDILVTFAPDTHIGLIAFVKMEQELSGILGRKVDLVTKSGLKPRIRDEVLAEARLLYAASMQPTGHTI